MVSEPRLMVNSHKRCFVSCLKGQSFSISSRVLDHERIVRGFLGIVGAQVGWSVIGKRKLTGFILSK